MKKKRPRHWSTRAELQLFFQRIICSSWMSIFVLQINLVVDTDFEVLYFCKPFKSIVTVTCVLTGLYCFKQHDINFNRPRSSKPHHWSSYQFSGSLFDGTQWQPHECASLNKLGSGKNYFVKILQRRFKVSAHQRQLHYGLGFVWRARFN